MSKPTKLKHCPFCGRDDKLARAIGMRQRRWVHYIRCVLCGMWGGEYASQAAATRKWNTRKEPKT